MLPYLTVGTIVAGHAACGPPEIILVYRAFPSTPEHIAREFRVICVTHVMRRAVIVDVPYVSLLAASGAVGLCHTDKLLPA